MESTAEEPRREPKRVTSQKRVPVSRDVRFGGWTPTIEVKASHLSLISHPEARLILKAAGRQA
jgi:hypothetical protein